MRAGTVLGGDFRLEHEIGAGGFGSVYRAVQLSTGRPRAVKVLPPTAVVKLLPSSGSTGLPKLVLVPPGGWVALPTHSPQEGARCCGAQAVQAQLGSRAWA